VTEQAAVIQYFLPLLLLVAVEVALAVLLVLEKQVALAVAAVTMVVLVALETHPQHPQAKVTMVEHLFPPTMVLVAVVVLVRLAQQLHLRLLVVRVVLVQHQASLVHQ
jgi:hypothetical protein